MYISLYRSLFSCKYSHFATTYLTIKHKVNKNTFFNVWKSYVFYIESQADERVDFKFKSWPINKMITI